MPEPLFVSIPEAARTLGIGLTKTKQLVATGRLRTVTIDRRRLVPVSALQQFADDLIAQAA